MRFESFSKTDIGLVRESNQDHVGCFPNLGLYVVADGMGGHADGEVASRLAVEVLGAAYGREDDTQPGRIVRGGGFMGWLARLGIGTAQRRDEITRIEVARLSNAIEEANQRIFDEGHADGGPVTRAMGTTVIAVVAHDWSKRLAWAHVGDSRLYRLRAGKLELLTADHTRFGEAYRGASFVPLDLPHTNQLTSALGVGRQVVVESGNVEVQGGDTFLLSSDGVSGLLRPEEITEVLAQAASATAAGEELIRRALAAGGNDNASVVVIRAVG